MKRILFLIIGITSLVLGVIGVAIPLLPSFPFLLAALYCFARSSDKLHQWFLSTKIYKNHLETYVLHKAMKLGTKLRIMGMVTALLVIGFIMMKNVPVGRFILIIVWMFHGYIFAFRVKTLKEEI